MSKSDNKMVTRSFRIRKQFLDVLEEAALERNVSVNFLVNEIINRFVEFDYPARTVRLKQVNDSIFRFLIEQVPRDRLIEFAKTFAQDSISGGVVKMSPGISEADLVEVMKLHCKYNALKFVETTHESKRVIIVVHDIGINESYFIGTYYKSLFDAIGARVDYRVDERSVVFNFG